MYLHCIYIFQISLSIFIVISIRNTLIHRAFHREHAHKHIYMQILDNEVFAHLYPYDMERENRGLYLLL